MCTNMLFGNTQLLNVLAIMNSQSNESLICNTICNAISHVDTSQFSKYLPDGSDFAHRITQAMREKKLYITNSNEMHTTIIYNDEILENLSEIVSIFFNDTELIPNIIVESLKHSESAFSDNAEFYSIQNQDNKVNITSIKFSPVKTDRMWNFYFMRWGDPYITVSLSKKEIILLNSKN